MYKWYRHTFRINRADYDHTQWWIDIFLIDTVIRDCINFIQVDVPFWRVHRRGMDDEKGHEVSFFYHTNQEWLYDEKKSIINNHPVVKLLNDNDMLKEILHTVNDSSICEEWPESLRRSWSHYVTGASEMLLELINNVNSNVKTYPIGSIENYSIDYCKEYYKEIIVKLDDIWYEHGSHAFLHHLSVIFGYAPLRIETRGTSYIIGRF